MDMRRVFLITVFMIGLIMPSEYPKHSLAFGYFAGLAMGGLILIQSEVRDEHNFLRCRWRSQLLSVL